MYSFHRCLAPQTPSPAQAEQNPSLPSNPDTHILTSPAPLQSSHALFESLNAQKRKDDPISIARRQSMNEQRPSSGFIGKMWNKYVDNLTPPSPLHSL